MADGGCDGRVGNDVVELEAMRKDTLSWHPCQISLCPKALGLIVQYEDSNLEEVISSKDGVLANVRVRSTPLQGDDCSSLQQGDIVLATQNSHVEDHFWDAQVKEVFLVRHSKRVHCRCSFKIQWLHRTLEEKALTVPASAIKKLSTKSIRLHSIISAFFCIVDSSTNKLKASPLTATVDGMKLGLDVNMLLEKQIEKINNLADAPDKKFSDNIAFKLKADLPLKDPSVNIPIVNGLKGSTRSKNELLETRAKVSTDGILPTQDLLLRSRSPLSPLAARAALAMLRSNSPQGAAVHSNSETGIISSSAAASSKRSATSEGENPTSIATTLFPASNFPQEVEFPNVSSRAQGNGMQKKRKKEEKKQTSQPSEKRVTRSKFNNGNHESDIGETPTRQSNKARITTTAEHTMNAAAAAAEEKASSVENGKKPVGKDALANSVKMNFSGASDEQSHSRRITRSAARQGLEKTNAQTTLTNSPIDAVARNSRHANTDQKTPPISTARAGTDTEKKASSSSSRRPPTTLAHRPRTRSQK